MTNAKDMGIGVQNQVETSPAPTPAACAPIDIIIPTFNERLNVPHALKSVRDWAANVFVVDSGSTDGTQELARSLGATVVEHPWEGYARQKNWALDNLPLKSPWTFILDADEVITPALRSELVQICTRDPATVSRAGFYVNRYLIFLNKRIQHCGYFPSWNLRLFKRGMARYEDRAVHEHMVVNGKTGFLKGLMEHEDRRGLEFYIAKHNRYSTLEAEAIFFGERAGPEKLKGSLFGNAVERRRFFKTRIYPGLPGKWLGRFIWMYVIKLGVLDGSAGLRFCLFISSHEFFTSLKLREMQIRASRRKPDRSGRAWRTSEAQIIQTPVRGVGEARRQSLDAEITDSSGSNGHPASDTMYSSRRSDAAAAGGAVREPSQWSLMDKVKRALWMLVTALLFRPSFHNWYGWRRLLLRLFGAKIGHNVRIRPTTRVEIPWNLEIADDAVVGDYAILYSLGKITIRERAVISQHAHLCAGTHDYTVPEFPLLRPPIEIGQDAWIAADAFIGPDVTVGDHAVVGARAVVVRDVPPNTVVAGNPARIVKHRSTAAATAD